MSPIRDEGGTAGARRKLPTALLQEGLPGFPAKAGGADVQQLEMVALDDHMAVLPRERAGIGIKELFRVRLRHRADGGPHPVGQRAEPALDELVGDNHRVRARESLLQPADKRVLIGPRKRRQAAEIQPPRFAVAARRGSSASAWCRCRCSGRASQA